MLEIKLQDKDEVQEETVIESKAVKYTAFAGLLCGSLASMVYTFAVGFAGGLEGRLPHADEVKTGLALTGTVLGGALVANEVNDRQWEHEKAANRIVTPIVFAKGTMYTLGAGYIVGAVASVF